MLEKIFDMDNPLMRALSVTADLILLNALFVIGCIPIPLWGASFTALNDVVWHLVRNEEGYIIRSFFRSYKANLKRGAILGILFLLAGIVLLVDLYAIRGAALPVRVVFYALGILLILLVLVSFALLSRYENTLAGTLKNTISVIIAFFPYCLGMLLFTLAYIAAVLLFWSRLVPILLLLGISLHGYVNALLYVRIFTGLDGDETEEACEN